MSVPDQPMQPYAEIERGPFPVRKLYCGWCHLTYEELLNPPTAPLANGQLGQCPRCGTKQDQHLIGRGEA